MSTGSSFKSKALVVCMLVLMVAACAVPSENPKQKNPMPHLKRQGTTTQLIVGGKPYLMLAGELHNSSTSNVEYMASIWPRMAAKNLNTVIAPVSWELIESEQGKFDFSLVDSMILGARRHRLRLVLLWFGSWKNGASTYIPSWVKRNFERFPRVKDQKGETLEILSTLSDNNRRADARAFAALMRHIRQVDGQDHTVIMMQIENEVGVLKSPRDYCDAANKAFTGAVPEELMDYLQEHKDALIPEFLVVWKANGFKTSGTWEEVFGKGVLYKEDWKALSYFTEELFMAWHYAQYMGAVAEAGKAEYPLPMFVNAWLMQPNYEWPGAYPSGGPLPQVMDIWRAGAPAVDFIAPDIYMPHFKWVCESYHRNGNPLFIPETIGGAQGAARVFYVLGRHDAMGFAPFGIDGLRTSQDDPLDKSYEILSQLAPLIMKNQGQNKMAGVLVDTEQPEQKITLGGYIIEAKLGGWRRPEIAGAIIILVGPDEYVIAGSGLDILFEPETPGDLPLVAIDFVDEGMYKDGQWIGGRRLNGDEVHTSTFSGTGLKLYACSIQRVKLYRYH